MSATSSVCFRKGRDGAAAEGHFIHVYVERATRRPIELVPELCNEINRLLR